jgi:hypothetical protein
MGPTLYRASGLQRYIERLYLAPDTEIDIAFAEKRLEAVADSGGIRRNLARLAGDLAHARRPGAFARPITAEHVWVRPRAGFEEVYDAVGASLRERGVVVRLGAAVDRIERRGTRFVLVDGAGEHVFDHLFSTIPLEAVARLIGIDGAVGPAYMDLYSLFYEYPGDPPFPYNVLHNFSAHGQWKRLTVLSRYYGPTAGRHYFTVEGMMKREQAGQRRLPRRSRTSSWARRAPVQRRSALVAGVVAHAYPVPTDGAGCGT